MGGCLQRWTDTKDTLDSGNVQVIPSFSREKTYVEQIWDISRPYLGHIWDISRTYLGILLAISWTFRIYLGYIEDILRTFFCKCLERIWDIFNRPGVAGAVLQTPSTLIH